MRDRFSGTSLATMPWGATAALLAARRAPTAVGAPMWTRPVKMGNGRVQEPVARAGKPVGAGTVMTLVLRAPRGNTFMARAAVGRIPAPVATPGGLLQAAETGQSRTR